MAAVETPDQPLDIEELEFVYELKTPIGYRPVLYILGGIASLALALVSFGLGLLLPPERQAFGMFIASTVVPTLGALALFGGAFGLMRSPRRVAVGSQGLTVDDDRNSRHWRWKEIGWATIGTGALSFRKQLVVFDPRGRKLVTLGSEFEHFDELAEGIRHAVDRHGPDAAERIRRRKARRSAAFLILCGVAFLALAVANGVIASREQRADRQLAIDGIEAEARIKRHYLFNVTPRLEYELTTPDGQAVTRDAMVSQAAWEALEGEETVRVRYVPADPSNSRLAAGEIEDALGSPASNLFLSIGVGMMASLFLIVGLMQWLGWDIDLDSKTGRVSIKRFGTGR